MNKLIFKKANLNVKHYVKIKTPYILFNFKRKNTAVILDTFAYMTIILFIIRFFFKEFCHIPVHRKMYCNKLLLYIFFENLFSKNLWNTFEVLSLYWAPIVTLATMIYLWVVQNCFILYKSTVIYLKYFKWHIKINISVIIVLLSYTLVINQYIKVSIMSR